MQLESRWSLSEDISPSVPFRKVGQNGKDCVRFFHAEKRASKRLGVGVGGYKGTQSVWASPLRSSDSSEKPEERPNGGTLGSGKWLTQWRKGFLNSSGPEPQGPGFLLCLAREVAFSEELLTAAAATLDLLPGH